MDTVCCPHIPDPRSGARLFGEYRRRTARLRRKGSDMRTAAKDSAETVVNAWRKGVETAAGAENPAGSLYIGGSATEAGLTDIDVAALTCGTACSGSRTRQRC